MFTQPKAEQKVTEFDEQGNPTYSWIPVRRELWPMFSTKSQATTLETAVKKVCPNAELLDGLNVDLWIPVRYLGDDEKIWVYHGMIGERAVDEFAGSLWDRQFKPNPFVDRPGTDLVAANITTDLAELRWGTI